MRRVLAITLLIAFTSPLVAPLFAATADPQASLPACCRRHGAHHCGMAAAGTATSPTVTAPPCPCYPNAVTAPRLTPASLSAAPALSRTPLLNPAPQPATEHRARTFPPSANLNRGPPNFLT